MVVVGVSRRVDAAWDALVAATSAPVHVGRDDVESMTALLDRRGPRLWRAPAGQVVLGREVLAGRVVVDAGLSSVEGPGAELRLSAGTVALRMVTRHGLDVDHTDRTEDAELTLATSVGQEELCAERPESVRGVVTQWSRASRQRMVRAIAELDHTGWDRTTGVLAMVTLTLPGDWQTVAPTGQAFKGLVDRFRRRWERAIGPWVCLWKLEFQRRGAPHMHMLTRVPSMVGGEIFERWLSATWADVVAHPDPEERAKHERAGTGVDFSGVKFSDPRRTSIYFLKHSAKTQDDKEYQHIVPVEWRAEGSGPGRFWGVCGLERAVGVVEMTHEDAIRVRRVLRHVQRARRAVTEMSRLRASGQASGVWSLPRQRAHSFGARGGGWVLVHDGLALAWDVGRYLGQGS